MANQILYGFYNLKDRLADTVQAVGIQVINDAIQMTLDEHNRQMNALLELFAMRTTKAKFRYRTPTAGRLQPTDEQGRAIPVRFGASYDVAFPMQRGALAWGQTYEASLKMTVEQANNHMAGMLTADRRWMRDHILAALFPSTSWTYNDADDDIGTLTIKGLANGDTDVYAIQTGADAGATDTHILAQANAIGNADDPFQSIKDELLEHPENQGEVVALLPTNLVATTRALSGFYPTTDPNIQLGTGVSRLVGDLGIALPGKIFGYHSSGVWLAEWKSAPSGYIIAACTQGERALAMREEPITQLQGFNRVAESQDFPFYRSDYLRKAGFGANNRVGAVVYRIGNASYAVPTNYSSPMP